MLSATSAPRPLTGPLATIILGLRQQLGHAFLSLERDPAWSRRYFFDLRLLAGLIQMTWPRAQHLVGSAVLADALDAHVDQQRRALQARGRHLTALSVYDTPPPEALPCAAVLNTAEQLRQYATANIDDLIAPLLDTASALGPWRSLFNQTRAWCSAPLQSAIAAHFTGIAPRFLRRATAIRLVQMTRGGSIAAAGAAITSATGMVDQWAGDSSSGLAHPVRIRALSPGCEDSSAIAAPRTQLIASTARNRSRPRTSGRAPPSRWAALRNSSVIVMYPWQVKVSGELPSVSAMRRGSGSPSKAVAHRPSASSHCASASVEFAASRRIFSRRSARSSSRACRRAASSASRFGKCR
jgi:hypothetical protein